MKSRWASVGVVAAIFAAGLVTGSLHPVGPAAPRAEHRVEVGQLQSALMKILTAELDLSPDQVKRIEPLVTSACEDYRNLTLETVRRVTELVQAANARIARELTPAQAERLQHLETARQELVRKRLGPDYLKRDFLAE